ncbi:hypothetical protein K466DRAFT_589971 [Polyporus arcularius HHB13444]|uniref:Uncharacterized protein n=1 Tax=Polyporus arcularius HHB13444 TaxID=1314778 RepID=A0A5C3P0F9_9APHY|nr:hypothetical protein K466DRAFT_589971 [Polyporus arcularius HHB13444]
MGYSGYSWYFDDARLEVVESIVASMTENARALYPWWRNLGLTLIDATMLTLSLGFLTLLTSILTYLVVSRRLRDSYLTLAIWVIPEWVSAVTTWIVALSRAAQEYALLGSYIPGIRGGVDAVAACVTGMDCIRNGFDPQPKPVYVGHGCVGTALLTGNVLIQEGVLCALVLFYTLPEHPWQGKLMRSVVIAPFLAACVSAAINVRKVCWPGNIILGNGMRIKAQWEVFDPRGIDPTTGKLTQLSHMLVLAVLAMSVWKHRHAYIAHLSGTTEMGYGWVRPLLFMNVLPPAVVNGLSYARKSYNIGRDSPIWLYTLFSAAYSILPSLMGMWPGLVMIFHNLRMPESILPVTQVKGDVGAIPPALSPASDVKVDHSAVVMDDAANDGHSQVSEKSARL